MGGGGQTSKTVEGELAKEQAKILAARQADYEEHFKPYIMQGLKENSDGTAEKANMAQQVAGINQSYGQAKNSFSQSMAQRGLGGTGVEAQGLAGLQNTRAQNLANAYYSAKQQANNEKLNYLQLALQMSPSTTSAAPTISKTGNDTIWNSFW